MLLLSWKHYSQFEKEIQPFFHKAAAAIFKSAARQVQVDSANI